MAAEEENIDDDLDFEVAKFTNTLRNSCRRPVTGKGRTAARPSVSLARSLARPSAAAATATCFYLRDE